MANRKPQKVNLTSADLTQEKIAELYRILPEAFSENKIDWEKLRTVLGEQLDDRVEKFSFTWAGKSKAIKNVLVPSRLTLAPAKDESVNWENTENLFIEGDNLEVLKLLQKAYFEKVKLIYIDPPYNTGNDFIYNDDFKVDALTHAQLSGEVANSGDWLVSNPTTNGRYHSDWLSMMYPRLKLAWNLLREDGVIFVSIDDHEVNHLGLLLDEIFGEENRIGQLVWKKKAGGESDSKTFAVEFEYIFVYAKNKMSLQDFKIEYSDYEKRRFNQEDKNGKFYLKGLERPERLGSRPNLQYPIECPDGTLLEKKPDGKKYTWVVSAERFEKMKSNGEIVFTQTKGSKAWRVNRKVYMVSRTPRALLDDIALNRDATSEMREIFNNPEIFSNPKPTLLIKHLIKIGCPADGVILDFFAGSGTTAQAVNEQNSQDGGNRKWICVQIPEKTDESSDAFKAGYKTIAEVGKERIRRAAKMLKGKVGKSEDGFKHDFDGGFKVFNLVQSNYVENLFEYDPSKTKEEHEKAFKQFLEKAKQQQLFDKTDDVGIVYENIVKEGFSLNSTVSELSIGGVKCFQVKDNEKEMLICLERKINSKTISELTSRDYKDKLLICLDNALTDSDKANLALNVELKTV